MKFLYRHITCEEWMVGAGGRVCDSSLSDSVIALFHTVGEEVLWLILAGGKLQLTIKGDFFYVKLKKNCMI